MLLLLAEYLQQFHTGFGVFRYLTLRGILGDHLGARPLER